MVIFVSDKIAILMANREKKFKAAHMRGHMALSKTKDYLLLGDIRLIRCFIKLSPVKVSVKNIRSLPKNNMKRHVIIVKIKILQKH